MNLTEATMKALGRAAVLACVPDLKDWDERAELEDNVSDDGELAGVPFIEFDWDWGDFPNPFTLSEPAAGVTRLGHLSSVGSGGEDFDYDDDRLYLVPVTDGGVELDAVVRVFTSQDASRNDNSRASITVLCPVDAAQQAAAIAAVKKQMLGTHVTNVIPQPGSIAQFYDFMTEPKAIDRMRTVERIAAMVHGTKES